MKERVSALINKCRSENSCELEFHFDELMAAHTTFKVGGPADCWLRPWGQGFSAFCTKLLVQAEVEDIPVFVLGGGANIVVSGKGIRGIVLDTTGWSGLATDGACTGRKDILCFHSGTAMNQAAEIAAAAGLSGLEFFAGMPGSVGGGVWMNARCYGQEVADVLVETAVHFLGETGPELLPVDRTAFGYKYSPFQGRSCLILSAFFRLEPLNQKEIYSKMQEYREDREQKGHYRYPCAGSIFKNNRELDRPVGKIIDELGLRGLSIGGAQIAPFHGNIIINTGGASAADIQALVFETAARVKAVLGFSLEPEILFVGEW